MMPHYYKGHRRSSSSSSSSSGSSDEERRRWKKEKKMQKKMMKHGGHHGQAGMNVNVHVAGGQPKYPYPKGGDAKGMGKNPNYPSGGGMPQPGYQDPYGGGGMPQAPPGGPSYGFQPPSDPGYPGGPGYGMQPPQGGPGYPGGPGGPGYGMQPPQGGPGYGMQPPQGGPGYGMQPPQGGPGYGAPPPQGGPGYGAPPPQGPGYGAPPPQAGYGAPPPQGPGYGAPPPQGPGYGAPPPQAGYGGHGHGKAPAPARPPPPTAAGGGVYKNLASAADPTMALSNQLSGLSIGPGGEQYSGTVRPAQNFNPEQDCKNLREAMRGIGTNEKALIEVTARRSADQRQAIKRMYKTMFGKDLLADLKSELSGNFENLMIALFADPDYYDAHNLRNSMKGAGTREGVLIEILCTRTNQQIEAIKERYKKEFNRNLEKDVVSETSGQFKRLLVSCLQANRSELTEEQFQVLRSQGVDAILNKQQVEEDANDLYNAGAKRWGTDESVFLRIMATRNVYHLRAVFNRYAQLHGKDIISVIKSEMSGDTESGYKAVASTVVNRPAYFAHELHKSMAGLGTNDSALIRIVVTRSEIDLANVKSEFMMKYKKTLASFIRGDTSGDYKNCLLAIVGE